MKDYGMEDGAFGGVFDGHGRNVQIVGASCWKHLHGSDGDSLSSLMTFTQSMLDLN